MVCLRLLHRYNPRQKCLQHCCKHSIAEDKPIMLDYWKG